MALLELRRFETTAYKSTSGSDLSQVPGAALTLDIYKQGSSVATANTVTTDPAGVAVAVYNVGRLAVADALQLGSDATKTMSVVSIDSDTQVKIKSTNGSSIAVAVRDRLVPTTNRPTAYQDSRATVAFSPVSQITLTALGFGYLYTPEPRFDYIIAGTGITTALYIDALGGWLRDGVAQVNVKNYATFQAAINALDVVRGGEISVPGETFGTATVPALGAMVVPSTMPFRMVGAGRGSTILSFAGVSNTDMLTINSGNFHIEGILFQGSNAAGSGRGLVLTGVSDGVVEDCWFHRFPSYAVAILAGTDSVNHRFTNVRFTESVANGLVYLSASAFSTRFTDCAFGGVAGRGIYNDGAIQTIVRGCTFDFTHDTAGDGSVAAMVYVTGAAVNRPIIEGCAFECTAAVSPTPNNWMIFMNPTFLRAAIVRNCDFIRTDTAITSLRAIQFSGGGARDALVDSPLGVLNGAVTPVGADDIKCATLDTITLLGAAEVWTASVLTHFTITAATPGGVVRLGSNRRLKLESMTTATRDALTGILQGDIVYNSSNVGLQVRSDVSTWRQLGVAVLTTAARDALTWAVGDLVYNTTTAAMNVCTVAGSPGTFKAWAVT